MFRYQKILGTACAGVYGLFIKARWPEGRLDMDVLLNTLIPSAADGWFMAFYGLMVGIFVVPYVIELIERGKDTIDFIEISAVKDWDKLGLSSLCIYVVRMESGTRRITIFQNR